MRQWRVYMAVVVGLIILIAADVSAQTLNIWPGVAPGSENWKQRERIEGSMLGAVAYNVVTPMITAFLPKKSKATAHTCWRSPPSQETTTSSSCWAPVSIRRIFEPLLSASPRLARAASCSPAVDRREMPLLGKRGRCPVLNNTGTVPCFLASGIGREESERT